MKLREIQRYQEKDNALLAYFSSGAVMAVSFEEQDIFRLQFNVGGGILPDPDRFVVENPPAALPVQVEMEQGGARIRTERCVVEIRNKPASVSAFAPDGRPLFSTKPGSLGDAGEYSAVLRLALDPREGIYGLGQDPMANTNQNGHERRMWNEWGGLHVAANAALPFYFSSRGYGLLLNSGWPCRFAVGEARVSDPPPAHSIQRSKGPWEWNESSGEEDPRDLSVLLEDGRMDVFIILRDREEAIRGYGELTGRAPMPPRWALGYMQSKNRYRTDQEFLELGKKYRDTGIPCDTLVLDWLWFRQFGDMAWDEQYWKNPGDMLQKLHAMGFHIMQAYHPFIYEDCLTHDSFRESGYLMNTPPHTLPIFDHSNPEAREAWWQATRKLVDQGIDAYWIDMGEPRDHPQGTTCCLGSREHVHNLYSLLWAKGIYEGHTRDLPTRPFLLSRTSYAGIQRYGTALWSNDIDSSWEVLKDQVPIGLGVCASGLPYWCTDIGGFATDDRYSPELFIRWLQWGVFCPLMRTHGTRAENEPWSYGEQAQPIIEKYIRLRYRLMPYIYSCAREIHECSKPMMRGLYLDFPDDPEACGQKYEFMFGPALLVAPVLDRDARKREVYLPHGVWYDFWTGQRFTGGRSILALAPLDTIPLYVREGSMIPMAEYTRYDGERPWERITAHVWGAEAGFTLYEDAGDGQGYLQGEYAKTRLIWKAGRLTAELAEGDKAWIPQNRGYAVEDHTISAGEDAAWHVDWDETEDGVTRVHVTGSTGMRQAEVTYQVELPAFAALTDAPCYFRKTPLPGGTKVLCGAVDFQFELTPCRSWVPQVFDLPISLRCKTAAGETEWRRVIRCGYGYVSAVQMLGFLDDRKQADQSLMAQIEAGLWQESYFLPASGNAQDGAASDGELSSGGGDDGKGGDVLYWKTCRKATCFGYLDMREYASRRMDRGRGTGYARFVVTSPRDQQCRFEISADRKVKLWVNGAAVYEKEGMLLKTVPDAVLPLRKGENVILVKCFVDYPEQRSGREIGFSLRLLDEQGKADEALLFSV